ncbi:MAG: hypothetical protein HY670_02365 [Chloroflexi bacterium]|nr:hypothetical protein [Chloroflexota bacterium]
MKKWETREWWEKGNWSPRDIAALKKEERERLEKQPWFEHGKPCRTDIFHQRNWQEEFEAVWGKWGSQGIGNLKKVGLSMPMEYELNPAFLEEPAYYRMYKNALPNLDRQRKAIADLGKLYESEGVEVIWLPPPETPLGPYGFMRAFSTPGMTPTRAGMILMRMGRAGVSGDIYNGRWFDLCYRIGCPVYHTMLHVGEITPIYLAEHLVMISDGYPTPADGALEYKQLLEAVGDEVYIAHNPGYIERWGFPAGGTSHLDMVLGVVDLGLAICYPSFMDYGSIAYLRSRKIRLIEVSPEEFVEYGCNVVLIKPGVVAIPGAAKETIKALKKEGVRCLEFDSTESAKAGIGGPDCVTAKLYREPGPSLADL